VLAVIDWLERYWDAFAGLLVILAGQRLMGV